jgi:hypothetical protein
MNRVLSWPQTPIVPGLLKPLKSGRSETVVTERGTVRFELPRGPVEMGFLAKDQELPAGTRVYVWWKGGGFVCASVAEARAEEYRSRIITERVNAARARLEAARRERTLRDSELGDLDPLPPNTPKPPESPLLQVGR